MLTIPQYLETILAHTLGTPAEADAVSLSALLYFQQQDWERARTMLNLIEEPDAEIYSYLGICASSLEDTATACKMFKLGLDSNPTNTLDMVRFGDALIKIGDPEQAAAEYQKAIELQPDFSEAYAHLIELHFSTDNLKEALAVVNVALEKCTEGLSILYNLQGITFAELDRLDEAALAFAYAASCNELDYNAWFNLGLTLIKLGRQEESDLALGRIPASILEHYLEKAKQSAAVPTAEDNSEVKVVIPEIVA